MRIKHIAIAATCLFLFACMFPSCAASGSSSTSRNYMLQDKSQYPRNKGKYKSSNKHVKQRNKNLKKIKRQQKR